MRSLTSLAVAAALALSGCGSAPPRDSGAPEAASAPGGPVSAVETQAGPFKARVGRLDIEVSVASADHLPRPQDPPTLGDVAREGVSRLASGDAVGVTPAGLIGAVVLIPVVLAVAEGLAATERARAETIHGVFARNDYAGFVAGALEKRVAPELGQQGLAQRLTVSVDRYGLQSWKDGTYCFAASGSARVERADGQRREARFTLAPEGRPGLQRPYCGTVAEFAAADGAMLERALRESAEELAEWLAPSRRADDAGTRKVSELRRLVLVPVVVPLPAACTGRERPWSVPESSLHGDLAAKLLNEEKGYDARLVTSTLAEDGQQPPERALPYLVAGLRDYAGNDARLTPPPDDVREAARRLAIAANADGVLLVERAQTCKRAAAVASAGTTASTSRDPVFTSYVSAAMFDATSGDLRWLSVRTDVAVAVQAVPTFRAYRSPLEAKVAAEMRHLLRDIEPIDPQLLTH